MKHGSFCTGIGGFDLAAEWMGWTNMFQCEIDPWCQKLLKQNFPNTYKYEDLRDFPFSKWRYQIDILTAGYPCQPFSVAGHQRAQEDPRHLWPVVCKGIDEIRPTWVVCENVLGHVRLGLDQVLDDLAGIGYTAVPFTIQAKSKGANHNRERVYIVANTSGHGSNESKVSGRSPSTNDDSQKGKEDHIDPQGCSSLRSPLGGRGNPTGEWGIEPPPLRVDDGLPYRMDRIKGLGNAVVPQVAYEIFKAISKV